MVDSISRIASALQSARVITLEAAAVASSKLGESSYTHYSNGIAPEQLRDLLNSRSSREVKDGLKRIIAIMASGDGSIDPESFFADVVKNIIFDDVKIKMLVCIYLQRYAERDPNLALLSINSLQKTLSDGSSVTRSLSIKALSDIKVPSLYPIVLHILKKSVCDPSPSVRNEVSFALLKLYISKGEEFEEEVTVLLKDLLSDADPQVVSSAISVLKECFPHKLELLHGHFRYYCKIMHELDSWAKSYLISLLLRYCKKFLPRPTIVDTSSEGQETMVLPERCSEIQFPVYDVINHPDLDLFLRSLEKLIYCSNPAVVISSSNAFFQLSTPMQFKKSRFPQALIRLISSSPNEGVKIFLLQSILLFSSTAPTLFLPYVKKFFILPSDNVTIGSLKLKILSILINESNVKVIVRELKHYISHSHHSALVIAATNALAECARLSPNWETHIMRDLISHMETDKVPTGVLGSYVNVIRVLVQMNPKRHLRSIMKLADVLEMRKTLNDNARAGIIWLFGEIAGIEYKVCPDILRKLVSSFAYEGPETRCQILLLSAKLLSYDIDRFKIEHSDQMYDFQNSRVAQIHKFVLYLSEFDEEFDIRDRARTISSLFDTGKYEIAALLFQAPKPAPKMILTNVNEVNLPPTEQFGNLGLDNCVQDYHKVVPWGYEQQEGPEDVRSPAALKDYSRYKKSFSSDSFVNRGSSRSFAPSSSSTVLPTNSTAVRGIAQQGKKYRLQTLDEFFSDIPSNSSTATKKHIVIQEESTSDEEYSENSATSDEDEEADTTDNSVSSSTSSSSGVLS